jgi:hemoglobin
MNNRVLAVFCMLAFTAGCMEGTKPTPQQRNAATGPAGTPVAKKSLYERLGGEPAITRVVDDLIVLVVADPNIRPIHKKHFMAEDVAALKKKLVDQIGEATGGPQKYMGKNMKDAHKGMQITDADFDALAADVAKALDQNKVGKAEKDELLGMLASMRADVVEAPK